MPILVLSPRHSGDSRVLSAAALKRGWEKLRLFEWKVPNELRGRRDLVVYGEHLFAELLSEELGLLLCDPPDDFLTRLPPDLLHRKMEFMTYALAREVKEHRFIKPPNFKSFKAMVYESGAALPPPFDAAEANQTVLVSEIVHWDVEFRCFTLDGKIIDLSAYARDGELNAPPYREEAWFASVDETRNAAECVTRVLAQKLDLPRACVIDVGHIRGKGWAVVEANPAWGSGYYGCDPDKILDVIQHAIVQPK